MFAFQRMGLGPILCMCICVTIDLMLNFNADAHADVTCKQSLTVRSKCQLPNAFTFYNLIVTPFTELHSKNNYFAEKCSVAMFEGTQPMYVYFTKGSSHWFSM